MTAPHEDRSNTGVRRPYWSIITIDGHPCELYSPPSPQAGRCVIYLHGLHGPAALHGDDGPGDETALRDAIEAARLPAVAPRTGHSWWLDRIMPTFDPTITPERFVVEPLLEEIDRRFGVRPPGVALLGVGMGGQGALRISYRHPTVFPVAAAIAPAIDFHLAMRDCDLLDDGACFESLWETYGDVERARQDTAILHVHPLNWPRHQWFASDPGDARWHDGAVRLQSKLRALGIPHTALIESWGPAATPPVQAAIRFILDALDQESRRLAY